MLYNSMAAKKEGANAALPNLPERVNLPRYVSARYPVGAQQWCK